MNRQDDALEIVMSWGGTPQQTELLDRPRDVLVGDTEAADFVLPREVAGEPFRLVEKHDDGWMICIPPMARATSEQMDLAAAPLDPQGARRVRMAPGATAVIELGDFAFHVRSTDARVELPGPASIDWGSYRWVGLSFLFHSVLIGIFLLQPPDAGALSIDLDGRNVDRMRYYMAAIERQQMVIDEAHLEGETGAATNEGRPMEGEEGAAGAPDETRNTGGGVQVRGPDTEARVPLTANDARSLNTLGAIAAAALGLSDVSSPYGDPSARGWSEEDAYGPLMAGMPGFGPGAGGFGMQGTGRGGCPVGATNCTQGTVGMGDFDTVGTSGGCSRADFEAFVARYGRAGAMDRCSGSSHTVSNSTIRRPGGEVPPRITVGEGEPVGGLSKEQVRRVVRRNIAQVRHCYEQSLQQRPDLEGRVSVQFVIQQSGAVMSAQVVNDGLGDGRTGQCVAQAVRRWPFPQSPGVTSVTYPFRFDTP